MTFARFVAAGFGSGFAPFAAGTVGTFVALIAGALLLSVSHWALALAALAVTLGGFWAVRACGATDDPGWVVIDEFAGILITLLALPGAGTAGLGVAFVLFRLLDITKIGPIGWADRRKDAIGVMGDDVIAGAVSALLLVAAQAIWPDFFSPSFFSPS